eukprot:14077668-Alexandrium_andersonii.AAC.1
MARAQDRRERSCTHAVARRRELRTNVRASRMPCKQRPKHVGLGTVKLQTSRCAGRATTADSSHSREVLDDAYTAYRSTRVTNRTDRTE